MTSILNKFKTWSIIAVALLFFAGMTLNSCSSSDKGSESSEEHPESAEGEEHPESADGEEHPEGEDEEHPEGEEHPEEDEAAKE